MNNWKYIDAVTVYTFNGRVRRYESFSDAVLSIGKLCLEIGDGDFYTTPAELVEWNYGTRHAAYLLSRIQVRKIYFGQEIFILKDELGIRIPSWRIREEYIKATSPKVPKTNNFRTYPAPGTGRSGRKYFRDIQTFNVQSANHSFSREKCELRNKGINVKGRSYKQVDSREDTLRSIERSWKSHRKHQYK